MYERTGTLLKHKFYEFLIPTVLTTIAAYTGNVINSILVGKLISESALSVTGLAMPIIFIMNAFFMLFAIGGSTYASIANGQRNKDMVNRIFTTTFFTGVIVTLAFSFSMLIFIQPISNMLAKGDIVLAKMIKDFFIPIAFNCPVLLIVMGMAYFVRIDGKPKIAANIVITSNLASLVFAYIFIKYFNWGMTGAGLATVVGYCFGFIMLVPYFMSKQRALHFIKPSKNDLKLLPRILSIGTPKALLLCLSFLRFLTLNAIIMSTLGMNGMVAMTVCVNSLMLASMFINGTIDTLLPIVGTLFGEKDYKGIYYTMKTGFRFMLIACIIVITLLIAIPKTIAGFFGIQSIEILTIVSLALRTYALSLVLYGINMLLHNFYLTSNRIKLSSLIVILNGFVFVSSFAYILSRFNSNYIWMAFLLSEAATFIVILSIGVYIRKKEAVKGVLLLDQITEIKLLDLTIPATIESSIGLSEKIMNYCKENNVDATRAMKFGIAVEEMAVNISKYGHRKKIGIIDVLVRITDNELILRIRDDGLPFDPTQYHKKETIDFSISGIEVVKLLAKNIVYSRQLGFNVCIVTV